MSTLVLGLDPRGEHVHPRTVLHGSAAMQWAWDEALGALVLKVALHDAYWDHLLTFWAGLNRSVGAHGIVGLLCGISADIPGQFQDLTTFEITEDIPERALLTLVRLEVHKLGAFLAPVALPLAGDWPIGTLRPNVLLHVAEPYLF